MFRTRWLHCVLWTIVFQNLSCEFLDESHYENTKHLVTCVQKITKQYFTVQNYVLIISNGDFINGEISRSIESEFGVNLVDNKSPNDFSTFFNFIILEDDDDSKDPYDSVENLVTNPRGKYLIVTKKEEQLLQKAASKFWNVKQIPNVIFLQRSNDIETIKIFGFEISERYLNSTRLNLIDYYSKNEFKNGFDLFPDKFNKDMEKKILRVTIISGASMRPEIYVTKNNGTVKINGIGSNLLNLFVDRFNFTMEILENSYFGHRELNGSWVGPPGQLYRGEADLSFAGIVPTVSIIENFEYSDSYRWDTMHFSIKMKGKTVSWKSLLKPLSLTVWICYVTVFLTALGLVFIVKKLRSKNIIKEQIKYMEVWKVLLSQSVSYPKHTIFRTAFTMWLLYGYLANICYTGSLVNYLSMPNYEKNLETFEELGKSDVEIAGHSSMKVLFGGPDPIERRIRDKAVEMQHNDFWAAISSKNRAIVLYKTTVMLHNWENRLNDSMQIHFIKDPVLSVPLFFYMRKGHPYRESLNNFIRKIHSSGIIMKWMSDYNAINGIKKYEQESSVLTLQHLAGVFSILIFGHVVSTFRFIFEFSKESRV